MLASYDGGPHLRVIPCHEIIPGYAAFEPVEIDHFVCSVNQSDAYKMAARLGMTPKRMRRVIDAQCVTPFAGNADLAGHADLAGLGDRVWIAVNVVRLEVSATGVTSAVERAVCPGLNFRTTMAAFDCFKLHDLSAVRAFPTLSVGNKLRIDQFLIWVHRPCYQYA